MSALANKIDADDKTLFEILHSQKYMIDFFQREYKWQRKHMEQLLVDFEDAFMENYKEGQSVEDVSEYNSYYLGPIIICDKSGKFSIVDGQQRLTSITLLLIYLYRNIEDDEEKETLFPLIKSRKYGKESFNIHVEKREQLMNSLVLGDQLPDYDDIIDESERNLMDRYFDIENAFPDHLLESERINLFVNWLKEKVIFVRILAYSDDNAYTIFETMNDRGFSITSSEMLKGYLLSRVRNSEKVEELNDVWKNKLSLLHKISKSEDNEFFKAWFRGKYAESIRRSSRGSENEDFELIGTRFHRWVKDNTDKLDLKGGDEYYFFIKSDFVFYADLYSLIYNAVQSRTEGLEYLHLNRYWGIASSLSMPMYISPIQKEDTESEIYGKLNATAFFIELFSVLRGVSRKSISQSTIRYTIYSIVKETRNLSLEELCKYYSQRIEKLDEDLQSLRELRIHQQNQLFIRYLVARITQYVQWYLDEPNELWEYMTTGRKNSYRLVNLFGPEYLDSYKDLIPREAFDYYQGLFITSFLIPPATHVLERNPDGLVLNGGEDFMSRLIYSSNFLPQFEEVRTLLRKMFDDYNFMPEYKKYHIVDIDMIQNWEDLVLGIASAIWNVRNFESISNGKLNSSV